MIQIEPVLASLSVRRPIFHSEADLQHELAHELRVHDPSLALRLEYPIGADKRARRLFRHSHTRLRTLLRRSDLGCSIEVR